MKRILWILGFLSLASPGWASGWTLPSVGAGTCSTFTWTSADAGNAHTALKVGQGELAITTEVPSGSPSVVFYAVPGADSSDPATAGTSVYTATATARTPTYVNVNFGYLLDPDVDTAGAAGGAVTVCQAGYTNKGRSGGGGSGGVVGLSDDIPCAATQAFRRNAGDTAWECYTPSGTGVILDLGDDAVDESTSISRLATVGDTTGIVTEPTADKVLFTISEPWPKATVLQNDGASNPFLYNAAGFTGFDANADGVADFLASSTLWDTGALKFNFEDGELEIPNGAAPTTNAGGEIALDTTIVDHQPLLQYYDGGENMSVIAVDTAQLPALDGEVAVYDAATDKFVLGAVGGAPSGADYLVGTTNGGLSNEIVVGTSPGGELGGTWDTPTLDDSVSVTGWTILNLNLTEQSDWNNSAYNDNDCTGDQGKAWFDSTDGRFEFCNANTGTPSIIATTSGTVTKVGTDCLSGDCFVSGGTGTKLESDSNFILEIDANDNGTNAFSILNGGGGSVFEIDEDGDVTATTFTADPSATPTVGFQDSEMGGTPDTNGRILVNCPTGTTAGNDEDCDMEFGTQANGSMQNAFRIDVDSGGTQTVDILRLVGFSGGGDIDLPANSVDDADLNTTETFDVSWKSPVVADDVYVKVSAGAITLTALDCVATGGTTPSAFVVTVDECTSGGATCVSSGGTVTLSALTTNTQDATFTDAAIDDDDWLRFDVTSLTTAPDYAHCRVEYTR